MFIEQIQVSEDDEFYKMVYSIDRIELVIICYQLKKF